MFVKKKLLSEPPQLATQEMVAAVETDIRQEYEGERKYYWNGAEKHIHYRWYYFARARVRQDDMLEISTYTRDSILQGPEPVYRIFIDASIGEWRVYEPRQDKWHDATLDNLDSWHGTVWGGYRNGSSVTTGIAAAEDAIIRQYLALGNTVFDTLLAVQHWMDNQRSKRRIKRHQKEIDAIDAVMNKVQAVPADFEKWIWDTGFKKQKYLFYKTEKVRNITAGVTETVKIKTGFCTACGHRNMYIPPSVQHKHNEKGECPDCGSKVTYKAWNRQKYVTGDMRVSLLNKIESGYIMRQFYCKFKWERASGADRHEQQDYERPNLTWFEDHRIQLNENLFPVCNYVWDNFKQTGNKRWCRGLFLSDGGLSVLYTKNIKELIGEKIQHLDIEQMLLESTGECIDAIDRLSRVQMYPCLEYLKKAGLNKINTQILTRKEKRELFDFKANNLKSLLKLDGQRVQRLKEVDGGCNVLEFLQIEQKGEAEGDRQRGVHLTKEQLQYLAENQQIRISDLPIDRTGLSVGQQLNYLRRQAKRIGTTFTGIKALYDDYLDMAEERGMDPTDPIVCKQTRMREFHDQYLEEKNQKENRERSEKADKKFQKIQEEAEKNTEHFCYEKAGYIIMPAQRASDLIRESGFQHHCVGASETYMRQMEEGTSYILFLRKKESPEIPYYTIETKWDGEIKQAYSAYNRKPDWGQVEKILKSFTREIGKRAEKEKKAAAEEATSASTLACGA